MNSSTVISLFARSLTSASCSDRAWLADAHAAFFCSSAVEHCVAEVLHLQYRVVWPALWGLLKVGLGHLADDDVVVAHFHDLTHRALDGADRGVKDRRSV